MDGFQIRVLLYTVFYRLMPELLRQGKVYIAETPLFEIAMGGKEKSIFAYTVEEKNKILENLEKQGKKYKKIYRSKGLGENNPDMLWTTTMCPETRKLVKLDIDVADKNVQLMSNMLFGSDVNSDRKDYIFDALSNGIVDIDTEKELLAE